MAEYAFWRPVFDITPASCQRLLLLNIIPPAPESPLEKNKEHNLDCDQCSKSRKKELTTPNELEFLVLIVQKASSAMSLNCRRHSARVCWLSSTRTSNCCWMECSSVWLYETIFKRFSSWTLTSVGKQIQSRLDERSIRFVKRINAISLLTLASSELSDW